MRTVLLVIAILAARPALAQQPAMTATAPMMHRQPTITVSARGDTTGQPDRVRIAVGVQTTAVTAADAVQRNARLQRAVLDTLRTLGIAPAQISTAGYTLYPERAPDRGNAGTNEPPRITGYTATNTVQIELRNVDLVGTVIDASVAKGANGVNSLDFYLADAEPLRRAAMAQAVRAARASAETIAHAAGGKLGKLLEVVTGEAARPYPVMQAYARAAAVSTPVEPGEQTVSAEISTTWEYVAGP